MADIHNIRDTPHFALEAEAYRRVAALMQEYEGRISLVGALGILDLVKTELIQNNKPS